MRQYFHRILACLALCAVLLGSLSVPASAAEFEDVPDSHWAAESIRQCVELGFFNGETSTRFGVGHPMTRSAFAVVLCRFFGWDAADPSQLPYADVSADAWYAGAVSAAYANGAITDQRKEFRPADPITREELAVMLVRALGYGSTAGLSQDLPNPFGDVTTNPGYITMAYHLGLVSGTSADTFSPDRPASREQVAVILMRLYQKLNGNSLGSLTVTDSVEDVAGAAMAAIPAVQLVSSKLVNAMLPENAAAVREAARQADVPALLYVTGSKLAMNNTNQTLTLLMSAVNEGGYDGLMLELSKLTHKDSKKLVQLITKLNAALEDKLLYLVTDPPLQSEKKKTSAYDYSALTKLADQVFLKLEPLEESVDGFMITPPAPPEQIYYAFASLQDSAEQGKLSLMFSPEHSTWSKSKAYPTTEEELAQLLEHELTTIYTSERYACSYFICPMTSTQTFSGWYLTQDALDARFRLASLLGADSVCLIP